MWYTVRGGTYLVSCENDKKKENWLYCSVLYCTVLCCTVLCGTVLYCTVLYNISSMWVFIFSQWCGWGLSFYCIWCCSAFIWFLLWDMTLDGDITMLSCNTTSQVPSSTVSHSWWTDNSAFPVLVYEMWPTATACQVLCVIWTWKKRMQVQVVWLSVCLSVWTLEPPNLFPWNQVWTLCHSGCRSFFMWEKLTLLQVPKYSDSTTDRNLVCIRHRLGW